MGGRLNLDESSLTLDGGTRPHYNLSSGYCPPSTRPPTTLLASVKRSSIIYFACFLIVNNSLCTRLITSVIWLQAFCVFALNWKKNYDACLRALTILRI